MKEVKFIVIHCADTPNHLYFDVEDIDRWHKEKGWSGCGYHFVITRDGKVQKGRKLDKDKWLEKDEIGAHAYGFNSESVGICLVGGKNSKKEPDLEMTLVQDGALYTLLEDLKKQFPKAEIIPHSKISPKTCPNFDLYKWLENGNIN